MPPVIIAAGIAAAATAGAAVANNMAASSRQDDLIGAAKSQQAQERADRAQAVALARQVSQKSYAEYAAINRLLQTKEQGLAVALDKLEQESKILADTDPVIKSAGENLYKMLNGEASSVLGPLRTSRDRQRQQLEGQLAARLGPGFRTSSAGIEALSKFDESTALVLADAQQKAIANVGGVFNSTIASRPKVGALANDIFRTAAGIDQSVLQAEQNIVGREVNAIIGAYGGSKVATGAVTDAMGQAPKGNVWGDVLGEVGKIGANQFGKLMEGQSGGGAGGGLTWEQAGLVDAAKGVEVPDFTSSTFGSLGK